MIKGIDMEKVIRWTILGIIAGVILAFNMYHADYKLLVAQVGTIVLVAMIFIMRLTKYSSSEVEGFSTLRLRRIARAVLLKNPGIWFLAVCVISFLMSPHKLASGQELYKIGTWVIFGIMVSTLNRDKLIDEIVNIWLICASLVAVYGILQFMGFDFMMFRLPHNRIVSNFGNSTILAGFLAMTLPLAFVKIFDRKKGMGKASFAATLIYRILIFVIIALILTNILLARSRSGILTAVIGLFILALVSKKIKINKIMFLIAGILAVIFILSIIPSTRDIIFNTILRKTARFDIWGNTFQLIRVSPLMGTGIGTFSLYFPNFVTEDVLKVHFVGVEFVNHAHCEYLEILSEMGALGLIAFLSVVGIAVYRFKKACRNSEPILTGLFAAFIAILVNNIVSVDLRYTSTGIFFWMIAGMLIAKKDGAISYQLSAISNAPVRKIISVLIAIVAVTAIYFTVKPYMEIQKAREQDFFAEDMGRVDTKIRNMEAVERKDADYLFNMGVLYAKKKDFKKAKEYFIETIRINPHHAGAFNNLGNIALLDEYPGSVGRARDFFLNAVKAEPNNADYLVSLAYSYFMLNEMEEAMKAVEKALSIEPNNSRALLLRRQMTQ